MIELWGVFNAWWEADGTPWFLWILLPVLLALCTRLTFKKGWRAFFAVTSLVIPLATPTFLPSSRPFETLDWVILSTGYLLVAFVLARSHLRQIQSSLKKFFVHFKEAEKGSEPKREWLVAEGASSFKVLIYGIYGLAGLLGSIICYLYIGIIRTPQGFIFQNNEGFIAALSLLIIVLAAAAVPIYTDLAKQVRTEIDTYESQISSLQQTSTNAGHHAEFLWTHFERVARVAVLEWSSATDPQDVPNASHLMLFMPFNALRSTLRRRLGLSRETTIAGLRDEVFKNFLADEPGQDSFGRDPRPPLTEELLGEKMPGAKEHYFTKFTSVQLDATWKRVLLFLQPKLETVEDQLDIVARRHRARRLKYLGWSMQGPMARAQARRGEGRDYVFAPGQGPDQLRFAEIGARGDASWEFQNSTKYLLPATEELFVALLQQKYQAEYDQTSDSNVMATTLIHKIQEEYKRRASRHLQQWSAVDTTHESSSLSRELAGCGNPLDIDISTLSDDLQLFRHFYIATRDGMNQGADARFLYYSFWLLALANSETTVSLTINVALGRPGEPEDEDSTPQKRLERLFESLQVALPPQLSRALHESNNTIAAELEFTLLSLADHKSALYNWLRAAKSVRTRRKLSKYEGLLDKLSPEKQLGIEVIPRRRSRLEHLRIFLDTPEAQAPLTVRSIFDLLPVDSPSIREQRRQHVLHRATYAEYRRLVEFLQIGRRWGEAVTIDNTYTQKVVKIDSRLIDVVPGEEIDPRANAFLSWITEDCLSDQADSENLTGLLGRVDNFYRTLMRAFWRISPTFHHEVEQSNKPASRRQPLSEEDCETELQRIHRRVSGYCGNGDNAEAMKNTFFGGANDASRSGAQRLYEEWRRLFNERAIPGEEAD